MLDHKRILSLKLYYVNGLQIGILQCNYFFGVIGAKAPVPMIFCVLNVGNGPQSKDGFGGVWLLLVEAPGLGVGLFFNPTGSECFFNETFATLQPDARDSDGEPKVSSGSLIHSGTDMVEPAEGESN